MAIRRPHKPPEAGTDVFTAALSGTPGDNGATEWRPENVDMAWFAKRGGHAKNFQVADRLRDLLQNTQIQILMIVIPLLHYQLTTLMLKQLQVM